ncbi:MAG: GIY-YIG nuclease family protein [Mariprofundaceae bacterium]|nr:GIY-YIG nuclease family protein [Mariprofundaceae bacterium]
MNERLWSLYLVRCHNNSLYTGISTDVTRRFAQHQAGKGAKYLRGKSPLTLVYQQEIGSHSAALQAEIVMKKQSKNKKEAIVLSYLARC